LQPKNLRSYLDNLRILIYLDAKRLDTGEQPLLYLTKEEESQLEGEHGHALEIAMSALVKLGDMYSADRMIKIDNVHVDASTYGGIHEAGLQFCRRLVKGGAVFRVPTTLCISAIDFDLWRELQVPNSFASKQMRLAEAYAKMGALPTWTCAPYQYGSGVRFGQNIAWAESNAIAFANSIVGARTNRFADLIDVCAGLVGKVPRFGLYLDQNRKGQVLFSLRKTSKEHLGCEDYAALGHYVGATVVQKIPVIEGLPTHASVDQLKSFAAAAAASGSVALFHMVGLTPEARTAKEALRNDVAEETVSVGNEELKDTCMKLSTIREGRPDCIFLGCPHYSVEQIGEVVAFLKGRKVRKNVQLWVFTSRMAKTLARSRGYVETFEASEGKVLADTCPLHLPLQRWNFQTMATDSAKMAHYAPSIIETDVLFASTRECLQYATGGTERVMARSWPK